MAHPTIPALDNFGKTNPRERMRLQTPSPYDAFRASAAAPASILRGEPPPHPPGLEHRFDLLGDEEARAVLVIALVAQRVIIGEHVPHIGDEREPGRLLGCGVAQAAAIERVIDHRAELMTRDL